MYKDLIEKYGNFCDSWIINLELTVNDNFNLKNIELYIYCSNRLRSFKYELIKILFINVTEFHFEEIANQDNFTISNAYIDNQSQIIFDFDPMDYFDYMKENEASKFKIRCMEIKYTFIKDYENN